MAWMMNHIQGEILPYPGAVISVARGCPVDADREAFEKLCRESPLQYDVTVLRTWTETTEGANGRVSTRAFRLAARGPPPQASFDTSGGIIVFGPPSQPKGKGKGSQARPDLSNRQAPTVSAVWGPAPTPTPPAPAPGPGPVEQRVTALQSNLEGRVVEAVREAVAPLQDRMARLETAQ